MFSSKQHINDVNDIPPKWIFENYFGLVLTGQNVRIKSVFTPDDKTPSMFIYYNADTETYRFKCFSSGKGGSAVELMMHTWNLSFALTARKISEDYLEFLKTGKSMETIMLDHAKWKVTDFVIRGWTKDDAAYWSSYNISSDILERYGVVPFERYTMSKTKSDGAVESEFSVVSKHLYGFFNSNLVLYKIYQPMNRERKFIKVCDHIQGYDQLERHNVLVIASSLKDCMTIKSMPGLVVDVIAPDSENTYISEDLIKELKKEYQAIVVMMDSDEPGIKSMKHYEEKHQLPFVYLPLEKDISDIVKIHGVKKGLYEFFPRLQRAIDKYKMYKEEGIF